MDTLTAHQATLELDSEADPIEAAEHALLGLADFIYAHTSLKPMSKTLFLISRCLLVVRSHPRISSVEDLCNEYERIRTTLGTNAPNDDFAFPSVVNECREHMPLIVRTLSKVDRLTASSDCLGLVFNTLLRGKWEGGEGLGTFLTPEEVVAPMVAMALRGLDPKHALRIGRGGNGLLFGDICGGTGRFVYSIARKLREKGVPPEAVGRAAKLFDQSQMAVDFGKLNFAFEDYQTAFECVGDSLTSDSLTSLKGRFAILATNPPFGVGKYRWSAALGASLPKELLNELGMNRPDDATDPAALFLFRNLSLLAPGGTLSIVLPDGIVQSADLPRALRTYERCTGDRIDVLAVVSLPVATFSLGGTVAKTSFIVLKKSIDVKETALYVASARHVGFLKRGNRRIPDPAGNDLAGIAEEFGNNQPAVGRVVANWREHERLLPSELSNGSGATPSTQRWKVLNELASAVRGWQAPPDRTQPAYHVSILDVDETGQIDIITASRNQPISKSLACLPGDILVSCLNPKIWRVTIVPRLDGVWSCSPEFLVLRPKRREDGPRLAVALHHSNFVSGVQAFAGGTSSSRQRVPKEAILSVVVPKVGGDEKALDEHFGLREQHYRLRLREARAYQAIHDGGARFTFGEASD